mmetsp:Transcript_1530/g.3452  ORF Transcript_1530/g.3452 Transcript_1530/m.3452 type:complete len:363 (+) Transcript_1530:1079-2167(+)
MMRVSRLKLSSCSVWRAALFCAMRPLILCRSTLRRPMAVWSPLTSFWWDSRELSRRRFFWNRMVCSARMRVTVSASVAFSFCSVTSSVWYPIHLRCRSCDSWPLVSISRCRFLMTASRGPVSSLSMPDTIFSNLLLSRSISRVFFSISSFLLLISSSYFSMVAPFSFSSSSSSLSVSTSRLLCASVLSTSTCSLASSFWVSATWTSSSRTFLRSSWMSLAVLLVLFSAVVWSLSATSISSSMLRISAVTLVAARSTASCSVCRALISLRVRRTCSSVWSSDLASLAYTSCSLPCFSSSDSICLATNMLSPSTFLSTAVRASFWTCCLMMSFLYPEISVSRDSSCCCCSRMASWMEDRASSRF